jgi:hypothetical protein
MPGTDQKAEDMPIVVVFVLVSESNNDSAGLKPESLGWVNERGPGNGPGRRPRTLSKHDECVSRLSTNGDGQMQIC